MKTFFTKNLLSTTAVLITMLVVGFGVFANTAKADLWGQLSVVRTLTYTSNGHGIIQGTSPQSVSNGGSGTTVTAVPSAGYAFSSWSDGVTTASRTDTNVTANISVSATFTMINAGTNVTPSGGANIGSTVPTYTVNYSAQSSKGTIMGTNPQTVTAGGNGSTVYVVPKIGWAFSAWSDGVTTPWRSETGVNSNISVTAQFVAQPIELTDTPITYSISYTVPGGHGSIHGFDTQYVLHGGSGTQVEAVPQSGYEFSKWSDGLTTPTRTDTGVTGNLEISALFVNVSGGGGGGGSSSGGSKTADKILGSGVCPLSLTLTQNLKSGAHDGEYLKYNGGIVTQVNILQKQINRILAASYSEAAGPVDGKFGPLTKLGVQRLQLALVSILHANLGPKGADGVVGPFTRAAINNSCGGM